MEDPEKEQNLKKVSKTDREAFNAIFSFVGDLCEVFGNKKKITPLGLYNRIVESTKLSDYDSIEKLLRGFKNFLFLYNKNILENTLDDIPKDTKILYGTNERICIEIQLFIYKTKKDTETREAIRNHLLNISCIIDPNESKIKELEKFVNVAPSGEIKIDTSTKEGAFINNIMQKAKNSMSNYDSNNPMAGILGIFQSGVVQDMLLGVQNGVASGDMKIENLLGTMQGAISSVLPPQTNSDTNANTDTNTNVDVNTNVKTEDVD